MFFSSKLATKQRAQGQQLQGRAYTKETGTFEQCSNQSKDATTPTLGLRPFGAV